MAAAVSEDPNEMQLIGKVLKGLKYSARDYVTWSKDQRVETIYKHQTEAGLSSSNGKGAAKASTGRTRLGGKKKGAAKPTAAPASLPASSGGGISTEQFQKLIDANSAVAETLEELASKVEAIETLVTETHFGFMCIALGDETIRGNFEDANIQEEMLGEPAILGGEEEEAEGEE
jgi:hypothetical protein